MKKKMNRAASEDMARAMLAAKEAEAAECRSKKAVDPAKRKRSTATRRKTVVHSTAPTTNPAPTADAHAEQSKAFLEAFYTGTPVEFLSDQRNIDS